MIKRFVLYWWLYTTMMSVSGVNGQSLQVSVMEESSPGTIVANIRSDIDLFKFFNQSAIDGLSFVFLFPTKHLSIDSPTGIIRTASSLDRDRLCPNAVACLLKADVAILQAKYKYFRVIKLTINIIDINDNQPRFPESPVRVSISEGLQPGTIIPIPAAIDPDGPPNGVIGYDLQPHGGDSMFRLEVERLDDGRLDVSLVLIGTLDRDVRDLHRMTLVARDGGVPSKSGSALVEVIVADENDNTPRFDLDLYNISVRENNKPRETILRVTATDTDSGSNSYVVYTLDHGTDPRFTINRQTGEISTLVPFDRERGDIYQFRVTASDRGTEIHNGTGRVVIYVLDENDEPLRFRQPEYSFNVSEDIPPGSAIGQLVAEDLDLYPNNRHSFHYLDQDDTFRVDELSGAVFLKRALDREMKHEYLLTVIVKDVGEPKFEDTAKVKVNVDDVNDNSPVIVFPSEDNNTAFVPKTAPVGHLVAKVVARDADLGENARLSYVLDAPDVQRSTKELFSIDCKLGNVVVNSNLSDHDRESIDLQIIVHDAGTPPRTSYATLRVSIRTPGGEFQAPGGFQVLLANQFLLIVVGGVLAVLVLPV